MQSLFLKGRLVLKGEVESYKKEIPAIILKEWEILYYCLSFVI